MDLNYREWVANFERRAAAAAAPPIDDTPPQARFPLNRDDVDYLRAIDRAFTRETFRA